ncbi:conserved protein of unknown function [Streptomyces murinus]|uniref:hypothetical protein n=1 Tax=Streptomyces murinus TaxID=33900 RepID=UPI003D6673B2
MPNPSTLLPDQVVQATGTLAEVKEYLRAGPPVAETLPLLAPLLDEYTGVPMLLGDILRAAARLVSEQADRPAPDEIRQIIDGLRKAAQESTDWHTLHWDIRDLKKHFTGSSS